MFLTLLESSTVTWSAPFRHLAALRLCAPSPPDSPEQGLFPFPSCLLFLPQARSLPWYGGGWGEQPGSSEAAGLRLQAAAARAAVRASGCTARSRQPPYEGVTVTVAVTRRSALRLPAPRLPGGGRGNFGGLSGAQGQAGRQRAGAAAAPPAAPRGSEAAGRLRALPLGQAAAAEDGVGQGAPRGGRARAGGVLPGPALEEPAAGGQGPRRQGGRGAAQRGACPGPGRLPPAAARGGAAARRQVGRLPAQEAGAGPRLLVLPAQPVLLRGRAPGARRRGRLRAAPPAGAPAAPGQGAARPRARAPAPGPAPAPSPRGAGRRRWDAPSRPAAAAAAARSAPVPPEELVAAQHHLPGAAAARLTRRRQEDGQGRRGGRQQRGECRAEAPRAGGSAPRQPGGPGHSPAPRRAHGEVERGRGPWEEESDRPRAPATGRLG